MNIDCFMRWLVEGWRCSSVVKHLPGLCKVWVGSSALGWEWGWDLTL